MSCVTLFTTAEYTGFAAGVEAAADTLCHKDLHLAAIEKAIPFVNKHLQSITSVIQTKQAAYTIALAQVTVSELAGKLDDFLTGSFTLTFMPGRSRPPLKAMIRRISPARAHRHFCST